MVSADPFTIMNCDHMTMADRVALDPSFLFHNDEEGKGNWEMSGVQMKKSLYKWTKKKHMEFRIVPYGKIEGFY
jgi:hypothetical protein